MGGMSEDPLLDVHVGHALDDHLFDNLVPVGDLSVTTITGALESHPTQVSCASNPGDKSPDGLVRVLSHAVEVHQVDGLVDPDDGQLILARNFFSVSRPLHCILHYRRLVGGVLLHRQLSTGV